MNLLYRMSLAFSSSIFALMCGIGSTRAADQPNIIFMLSDDQGWSGLSVAMHPNFPGSKGDIYQTPNIERLALQGMRFSNAYSPAPVCSPSRISLQTGKSPAQLHWTKAAPPVEGQRWIEPRLIKSIAREETTIGELLQHAGYATAHYGKWHISGGGPGQHGYDEHDGDTGNENAFKFTDPNPVDIFGMASRAAAFMERNARANKPFYIQLSWNALHASELAMKSTMAKYEKLSQGRNDKQISTAAITEDLDTGVGKVLEAIDRLGLAGNTYVIYMSDNGAGGGRRVGLNGGKGSVWEGGIRVPLIIRGPGIPANSWSDTPVVGWDLLPTFCELAGVHNTHLPQGIEGGSIATILKSNGQGTVQRIREGIVFHFPHYQSDDGPQSSIRLGNMKLIHFYDDDRYALFDLEKDIGERNDLAKQMPDEVRKLGNELKSYLVDIKAQELTPNAQFDPSKSNAPRKGKGARNQGGDQGGKQDGNGGGSRLGNYTEPPPANNVPEHVFNIVLGRPTDTSITVRVLFNRSAKAFLTYGTSSEKYPQETKSASFDPKMPKDFVLTELTPNTRYYYRIKYSTASGEELQSEEYSFHTQRASGSSFAFTIQSDSHLDENTSGDVYLRTLANALSDQPDFHLELGDTFMTGKYVEPRLSEPQYYAQRYYLGHLCHSSSFFFALGNHDGESGSRGDMSWASQKRKQLFPNPFPDRFYTGNDQSEAEIGLPENYYQWKWGDAQFIVLDPFRYTKQRGRSSNNWAWTLGERQYQWLKSSLENVDAKYRFVFLHHLVGGSTTNNRGGIEVAPYWEWGGKGESGEDEFAKNRPGWEAPIHDLLRKHGVSAVFHGHDHLFIKQDLDGIVYQLVPQPGHARIGNTNSAKEYGYIAGETQSSSGHIRVRVSPEASRVDYVRAYLPENENKNRRNGEVTYSYEIRSHK